MAFRFALLGFLSLSLILFTSLRPSAADTLPTPAPSGSISADPSASATPTPTPMPTSSPSASPSSSPSASPSISPEPSGTPTPSPTFSLALYSIDAANSLWVVVNKKRPLNPINYKPKTATPVFAKGTGSNPAGLKLATPAAKALVEMAKAAYAESKSVLVLSSGYRSFTTQTYVHAQKVAQLGKVVGENLAARPGYSEHQTGLAADLSAVGQGCVIRTCFAKTTAGKWLAANSHRFGFVLRYPSGRTAVTGYQFEPWHFRFVGVELATYLKTNKISVLENAWSLPAAPSY